MKRLALEEMLQSEFRWPRHGDAPFVPADDPLDNALVAENELQRLVLMTKGYNKAADLMVDHTVANPAERDFLVAPIIFSYRHFIELSVKYLLATYGPTVGVDPVWQSHDLSVLWAKFVGMLDAYGTADPDDADPIVAATVAEFAKIDPGSYSYRYPLDTRGQPLPIRHPALHLPTLSEVMTGVAGYFTGCDGFLSEMQSAARDARGGG